MNQEEIKNSILERFNNLQPEIQAAILNPDYEKTLYEIGQTYKLTYDQLRDFEFNTTLVLVGQTHPDQYNDELLEDLKLPPETIKSIVNDVNERVLKNILGMIKQNFIDDEKEEEEPVVGEKAYSSGPKLDERLITLPKEVGNALAQSEYQKKLYDIGIKNKLPIDKMGALEDITVKFINGSVSPSQYENQLALATDLPADKVKEIAQEVNVEILKNIRDTMKKEMPALASIDDEVPIPPYKEAEVVAQNTAPVINQIPKTEFIPQNIAKIEMPVSAPEKIYSPAKETIAPSQLSGNMLASKLQGITIGSSSITDHSLPKIGEKIGIAQQAPTIASSKPHDPYKEAI